MTIEKLANEFIGGGEVKGFNFRLHTRGEKSLIYEVDRGNGRHYEVFKIELNPKCVDFQNRIYSSTEFRETYPKSTKFGKSAWCISDEDKAVRKFKELEND